MFSHVHDPLPIKRYLGIVRGLSDLTVRNDRKVATHRMKVLRLRNHGVSHSGTGRVYDDKDIEPEIET